MSYLRVIILAAAFLASGVLSEYDFPKDVKICRRTETGYENCFTQTIKKYWSSWVPGVPSLGMPSLDPLIFPRVEKNIQTGLFKGNVKFRDLTIHGMANTRVEKARAVFKGDRIEVDVKVTVPTVFVETDYKANGNVNTFLFNTPVGGTGRMNVTVSNLSTFYRLNGRVKNDKWVVEHFNLFKLEIGGMKVYFSDLLNGNKALNDATMAAVNSFWSMFFNGLKPAIEAVADPLLSDFVNRNVFSKIPASKLFPA